MAEKKLKDAKVNKRELRKLARQVTETEEQSVIKKFIIILLVLVILIVGVYFFTRAFVTKDLNNEKEQTKTEVTFDYSKTVLGSLLNRPYNEYYVLVYNSKDLKANYYNSIASSYQTKEGAIKIYIADLNDSMNEKFYNSKKSNPNAKSIDELQVGNLTLIKVKDKTINKYIEKEEDIRIELGL